MDTQIRGAGDYSEDGSNSFNVCCAEARRDFQRARKRFPGRLAF